VETLDDSDPNPGQAPLAFLGPPTGLNHLLYQATHTSAAFPQPLAVDAAECAALPFRSHPIASGDAKTRAAPASPGDQGRADLTENTR
jgi:hypothetical protein